MVRKTSSGQILIEFFVLFFFLSVLYFAIDYKAAVKLDRTKSFRWEKQR